MKIGFTGASSTGKTTLAKKLCKKFAIAYIGNITRKVAKDFPINESGNVDTQLAIMLEHFKVLSNDKFITDRTLIDCLAVTRYLFGKEHYLVKSFLNIISERITEYDYIIYTPIEFDAEADGERSTSDDFRKTVDDLIRRYLFSFQEMHPTLKVIQVTGSVEDRLEQIYSKLPDVS